MLQVEEACRDGGGNEPDNERSRHGRVGEGHVLRVELPRSVGCYRCITAGRASCPRLAWRFSACELDATSIRRWSGSLGRIYCRLGL